MKKLLLLGLLPLLALTSCGSYDVSLYNKTYKSGVNEIWYNLDAKPYGETQTLKEILVAKIAAGKVNWQLSGNCDKGATQILNPFTPATSIDSVVNEINSRSKIIFGNEYDNLTIQVGAFKDGKADGSITKGGKTKNVVFKPYNESGEADATFLYIYEPGDLKSSIGDIDGACMGGGCYNGKWSCVCLGYESNYSRTNYCFSFTDGTAAQKLVVYSKIAN